MYISYFPINIILGVGELFDWFIRTRESNKALTFVIKLNYIASI